MFHLNLASLGKHKNELVTILSLLSFEFDIIAISETKILKDIDPIYDINLPGYRQYSTPTESSKGGVMIFYKESFTVNRRKDLEEQLYESRESESITKVPRRTKFLDAFIVILLCVLNNLISFSTTSFLGCHLQTKFLIY